VKDKKTVGKNLSDIYLSTQNRSSEKPTLLLNMGYYNYTQGLI